MPTEKEYKSKDGLPRDAFAIAGDSQDQATWHLLHHTGAVSRARGWSGVEKTVDWEQMRVAVAALSPGVLRAYGVHLSPGEVIAAARHLAGHYQKAGQPLPDILAALA